jgi:hypothetical protein
MYVLRTLSHSARCATAVSVYYDVCVCVCVCVQLWMLCKANGGARQPVSGSNFTPPFLTGRQAETSFAHDSVGDRHAV